MDFFLEDQDITELKTNQVLNVKVKENLYSLYLITNKNTKKQVLFLSYSDEIFDIFYFVKSVIVEKYLCPLNVIIEIKEMLSYSIKKVPILFGFQIEYQNNLLQTSVKSNTIHKKNSRLIFAHSYIILKHLIDIQFDQAIKAFLFLSALEHSLYSKQWNHKQIVETGNIASSIILGYPYLKQYSTTCDDLYYASDCYLKEKYKYQNQNDKI